MTHDSALAAPGPTAYPSWMKRGLLWLSAALVACAPAPLAPPPRPAPIAAAATVAPAAPPRAAAAPAAAARAPAAPADAGDPPIRRGTRWSGPNLPAEEKVRQAEQSRTAVVRQLFAAAGVAFPPKSMLFRAFKRDKELEVWASSRK